ncbi:MAG: hypothetical protein ACOYJY_06050 [Acutalibacteraceae bacterium]|jgi:hypothetical protein
MPETPKKGRAFTPTYGDYAAQPITKPDQRYPKTRVARPDDDGVEENRDWVMENEK